MKRLVAYSSVGHMGFVALGIAAWTPVALSGAVLQMVNHGITTGALFAMVGMLDERTGHAGDRGIRRTVGQGPALLPSFSSCSAWPRPGSRGSTTSPGSS